LQFYDLLEISQTNPYLNKAINIIAEAFSTCEIKSYDEKGNEVENCELKKLLLNPNPNQNFIEFSKEFVRKLLVYGFVYQYPYHDNHAYNLRLDKNPQLYNLNSANIDFINESKISQITPSANFNYHYNSTKWSGLSTKEIIPYIDFLQDSKNKFKGISRIESLKNELKTIHLSDQANESFLKLTGSIVVSQKPVSGGGDEMAEPVNIMRKSFNKEEKSDSELLEEKLHTKGLGQQRQIFVSQFPLEVQALTKDIKDSNFNEFKDFAGRLIYSIYNIPLGYYEQSKFNNRDADKLELYESVVIPIATNLQDSINSTYNYKNKIKLSYDHLTIFEKKRAESKKIQTEQQNAIIEQLDKLKEKGYLTEKEVKQKLQNHGII